jgi:hypothetical protein
MKTPQEKYMYDPNYRCLVDMIENQIHVANFTPSEIREASMLACIKYEMHRAHPHTILVNKEVDDALNLVHEFLNTQQP